MNGAHRPIRTPDTTQVMKLFLETERPAAAKTAVGFAIEKHSDEGARDAEVRKRRVTSRLKGVTQNHADD